MPTPRLTDADYQQLADFRHALRRFLYFSEQAAAAEDLTPQQYQAMLAIRGSSTGAPNVRTLADRMCLKHHTMVELLQRLEKAGLIHKIPSDQDGRAVILELTSDGLERLDRLVISHRTALKYVGPEIINHLSQINH